MSWSRMKKDQERAVEFVNANHVAMQLAPANILDPLAAEFAAAREEGAAEYQAKVLRVLEVGDAFEPAQAAAILRIVAKTIRDIR